MATTDIQWTCADTILTLLRGELQTVQVSAAFPGDTIESESVWLDDFESVEVNIPVLTAARKTRDDIFQIPIEIRVAASLDLDETQVRLSEIIAGIENVLADDPSLDDLDGVIAATLVDKRRSVALTKQGCIGFAQLTVQIHSRLV